MKKRLLTLIPILALILVCIPMAFQVNAAAKNSVDITVSIPETVKVGQTWNGIVPDITVDGKVGRYSLTVGTNENDIRFEGSGYYVRKTNTVNVSFCLYPVVSEGQMANLPDPTNVSFTVNGQEIPSDRIMMDYGETGSYYRIEYCEVNLDLSDRATYSITADNAGLPYGCYMDSFGMPTEAEAGANIRFLANFSSSGDIYTLDYYTLNGEQIANDTYFVMPAQNVSVGAKITDKYEGWQYIPEINITLDFNDKDIYYGNKIPTSEDFFNALSVSCTTPGVNVYVREADVDTLWDESTGGDLPWVGNQFLSFWIEAEEGYLISNPYLSDSYEDEFGNWSDPRGEWHNENLKVTVNGVERHYIVGGDYADGYFVSGYYVSNGGSIEIHVHWSIRQEIDIDLSNYVAGDTVTISDSLWIWDGYMPTGYELQYTHPENGEMTEIIYGKTFTMPDAIGEVSVLATGVRGKFNAASEDSDASVVLQQSEDSDGHISLDVKGGTFSDVTVLQINKINGSDFYGGGYEILDLVNRTLSDVVNNSVTFEITALSYNQEVQPTKKIIVTFPIPEGFDSDYIAFYHVDKNGTYEIVPAEIDRENGVCRAVIEHFSTYAIVSLNEASNLPTHIIHDLTLVPEKEANCTENGHSAYYTCSGCDKWFADEKGETEITDKNSISVGYESDGHTGGTATCSQKAVCTECEQEYGEYNAENHVDTEVINAKTENCGESGYTGDTYCNDCQKTVAAGTTIDATGEHTYHNGVCSVCDGVDPNYTPDSPATGDDRMIHLWLVLLAVSALGIVAVMVKRKAFR